ncbi:MAG: adenosylcobinamide-GDP ribazoletransferase, partial [Desulfuromonadales bacterium]|nr:adenosylcobinamide-GDP ribazoletransferase [Desulfuromonadales bacterium]
MRPFFAAISFLTVLPLPQSWCGDERALGRSLVWFPLVGLLIGCVMALLDLALYSLFPGLLVPSALLLIAMIAVSGGLHLDGLADSADAFMSSRPREQMLEIMKDSRCGPMGVIVIVALLLLKFSALASLSGEWRTSTIVLMPLAGRVALVLQTVTMPYARPSGLVSLFEQRSLWQGSLAAAILAACGFFCFGWGGLWIALACFVVIG